MRPHWPESILYSSVHDRIHYVLNVYSRECSGYCCVHKVPVKCTLTHTELPFENCSVLKVQILQTNRVSQFYKSNKSISLSQIFEFIFGKDVLWDNRHRPHTSLLW